MIVAVALAAILVAPGVSATPMVFQSPPPGPPPNDNFADAKVIPSLPFDDTVDTAGASVEAAEPTPSCGYNGVSRTVWYAFTATSNGTVWAYKGAPFEPILGVYTGDSLAGLTEVGCRNFGWPLAFRVYAGTTYYLQAGNQFPWEPGGLLQIHVEVAPPPEVGFSFYPPDPTVFDTVNFRNFSWDPPGMGIQSQTWYFGDGSTSTNWEPTYRYANDGDYTVRLTVITTDGRTASTTQTVPVKTHDVAITKFTVPQSASSGQTRQLVVGHNSKHNVEEVRVEFFKSVPNGYEWFATLFQTVPVRSANRTTDFLFSYTFTKADATIGKVTFRAVATIIGARDALPADNEAISLPTKVNR